MLRIFALLLLFVALVRADDELLLDGCTITLPGGAQWQRSFGQKIPDGEVVLHATRVESRQMVVILMVPSMPGTDVMSPSVINQLLRILSLVNSKAGAPELIEVNDQKFAQFVGGRGDAGASDLVSLARVILRGRDAYLAVMFAPTREESAAVDKQFTKVLDTFRLVEPDSIVIPVETNPLFSTYRFGWMVCATAAGGLIVVFCIGLLAATRRNG